MILTPIHPNPDHTHKGELSVLLTDGRLNALHAQYIREAYADEFSKYSNPSPPSNRNPEPCLIGYPSLALGFF